MGLRLPGTLSARIIIGFMVLVVTFGGISLSTVLNLDELNRAIRIIHSGYLQLALVSRDLDTKQDSLRSYLREEMGEESSARWAVKRLERLLKARAELLERTETILSEVQAMVDVRKDQFEGSAQLVSQLRKLVDEGTPHYQILVANPPIAGAHSSGQMDAEIRDRVSSARQDLLRIELRAGQLTEELKKHENRLVQDLSEELDEVSRSTWLYTLLWGASAVILGVLMTIGATVTLRPLKRLRDAAARIANGDYEHRIPVKGPREIRELAEEFNVMGQAIDERSKELVRTERLATAGKMAAMITHEVRNPLSSIGLNTELMEEEFAALPEEQGGEGRALCQAITKEVDRLTEITEEYLQLARLPTPKLQEESIERIIKDVVEFLQTQLLSSGLSIELELPEAGPRLAVDEAQLRQALLNLLRNACDALESTEEGRVSIRVVHEPEHSSIEISDNGPGIPEQIADRLFEAFVSSKSSGTGLGLALTQQIIQGHGGSVEARNAPEGGAIFTVRLPRATASTSTTHADSSLVS